MNASSSVLRAIVLRFRAGLRASGLPREPTDHEPPLRSELFSADQMEQHGRRLAGAHKVSPERPADRLLTRLAANEDILVETCGLLTAAVMANRRIAPAGEWLLDNFHLVEEQIRMARRHLPKGYSRELPRLAQGPSDGLPRAYDIALEAISHGDARVDPESLGRFIAAYQQVTSLKLGELWAIPIMLRLALIENLRRVGARIGASTADRDLAGAWADQMMEIAERDPKSLILIIADMARSSPPMTSPFVSEFARRLQGQSPALALPLTWIEQRLSESGLTIERLVQSETQIQAADQVSISNSIGSLRFLAAMDWREFVETASVVEHKLREDPGGVYARMDFASRDRYRHVVEKLAKASGVSESEVARKAIQLAHESAARTSDDDRAAHVGFYLVDNGLPQLERTVNAPLSLAEALRKTGCRFRLFLYLGAITLFTAILTVSLSAKAHAGAVPDWLLVLAGILTALCASHLAVAIVNWLATLLVAPRPLPRMDFSGGIPPEFRTLAVVPSFLVTPRSIENLAAALEVRFLANRDANLCFGLLTDFRDASEETLPEDEPLLRQAARRIEDLNEKYRNEYPDTTGDIFFLFHRPRRWNPQEKTWMGYERKRGKLADLNSLLRGGPHGLFSLIVGGTATLPGVKYVITLDTDTELPRDSARQLVGAMAHPLNRPRYDDRLQRICEGYAILQPRMGVSLPGTNRSRYARLFGSEPGIDPYTRAVSDVYQDLFGEGSFIGKGIYDVEAFERALTGRFPENAILSHDLLEGCYARSALLSDVQLYEEYPSRYQADVSRRHRWMRGDWQIVRWLLPRVPAPGARSQPNPLSALSRWKIFDNLRRSLVPPALTVLLVLGWTVLTPAWFWTLAVVSIILAPPLIASILELLQKAEDVPVRQHLPAAFRAAGLHFSQALFALACLPFESLMALDAIVRTTDRMLVTRRHLLEWNPAGESNLAHERADGLLASYRAMWIAPFVAVATAIHLAASAPVALTVAGPILFLWFAAPAIAWWISRPLRRRASRLGADQTLFLRRTARKTWAFFETFIGAQDHWLPPDNYQDHPVAALAHRTSPTNMGLALLANLSAYDFGYIHAGQLIDRTGHALDTMAALERHEGHFYNWYDTQSLKPLPPLYVSSVDSGNLAGHLLTLRRGLMALPDDSILGARLFEGLDDTCEALKEVARGAVADQLMVHLNRLQRDLESAHDARPATLAALQAWLARLGVCATDLAGSLDPGNGSARDKEAQWWADALAGQTRSALDELTFLAPWIVLPAGPERLAGLLPAARIPTLRELSRLAADLLPAIGRWCGTDLTAVEQQWLLELERLVTEASSRASQRIAALEGLALTSGNLAGMEYDFLYDNARHLLAIGYNVGERRRDSGYYDLLASEARFSTFVAIAQGKLPQESWFALGRLLTAVGGDATLLSWSGSMFEYLMPLLVMPAYENTLLDDTCRAAVKRQIAYGSLRGVPWGISECGYNTFDAGLNYQYRAFGVPGLGLKRGLADDLVIAPYASALALMVAPEEACSNLQRLAAAGLEGRYGFYEAIDYTPSRLPRGQSHAVVRSFMAHHQGMIFLSLAHSLMDRPMQKRFESEPAFRGTVLLLQERVPRAAGSGMHVLELSETHAISSGPSMPMRVLARSDTPFPEVQLLSNGRYHVMVTNAGGGYSRWKDLAVTRWREDTTCDNWGTFCYVRDAATGEFWSAGHQPTLKRAQTYEAIFSEARVEFRRRDHDYETHAEIVVSPEDDIELRRLRITNRSRIRRVVEVTSYAEVVLAPPASDALHPAFSNLFVQTEIVRDRQAILCSRRPRSVEERPPWMFHLMAVHGVSAGEISYETDRARFIGRGRTVAAPQALSDSAALSGSEGSVLDPVVAIRQRISLDPEETATIDMVYGIGETRDACLGLAAKYQDLHLADRVFDLAWTHSWVTLRQINATESDAQLYGRLASSVIYANSSLRADTAVLARNRRGQSGLWGYAISGDLPIVLLQIADAANLDLVRQLVQAHAYWRLKGLAVDLVIWNDDHAGYRQLLQDQIMGLIAAGVEAHVVDRPGGIFVRRAEQMSDEDRVLLQSVARAIISDGRGPLAGQINPRTLPEVRVSLLKPTRTHRVQPATTGLPRRDLLFFNGLGGYTPDGREYVITTTHAEMTPAPWVNVLANAHFGTVISENGGAYTWSENAHEFRLTPWGADPVSDAGGEAFYLRDDESGYFWSPAPLPSRGATPYASRHGFGYSVFEHAEGGIVSELTVYVDLHAAVKFSALKVRNESGRPRRLSATGYVEWVLGDLRPKSAMHVITEIDPASGALCARNAYNIEFADRIAFFDVDDAARTVTGDRTEFIGRNGTLKNPAAMSRSQLSNRTGAALDPCGAIQVSFELADGQEREIIFRLGVAGRRGADDAARLIQRFRGSTAARSSLAAVWQYWAGCLGALQVETPDQAVNALTNGWLVYQTLACRLWARSGHYQSGGAFGFRDQLQDVMALIHSEPGLLREHLLRCAARQFREGDVQHWWHPSSGRGVRTHCSDDYLWLPLATCRYVLGTGDTGVLDEPVHFLEGRPVNLDEDSYYDLPARSDETASLYEHCVRAIVRGLRFGEHGLPLMGSGDWNDGMNLVGIKGKGESVWLGFFLYEVLRRFSEIASLRDDASFAERCRSEADQMRRSIEQHGWDGQWYRRAYFDDGAALGSTDSAECQIDSIAQSWSVLSGAGEPSRARMAMNALDDRLVRRDQALIRLLDPPFDRSALNPGYIKGYVPGVRENGGQYTHAAIWAAMAFAALGDGRRAWELTAMINPINHARSAEAAAIYKVEPYVVAADVYAVSPHIGRGGWTWYTGSAGWTYRLIVESLLGLKLEAGKLRFAPCFPPEWQDFKLRYRHRDTLYRITVSRARSEEDETGVTVDGVRQPGGTIPLVDDRREHLVEVRVFNAPS